MDDFGKSLDAYDAWRRELGLSVQEFVDWVDSVGEADLGVLSLYEAITALKEDRLTIAIVGEYSRGKTELINALFFGDLGRRLLPSTPGRTTMCPMEIGHDQRRMPSLRLLPIETRKTGKTVDQYRKETISWTTHNFEVGDIDSLSNALNEIIRTRQVSADEAEELGFQIDDDSMKNHDHTVTIPFWRYAVLNYPHPSLSAGLTIVDTPGLNALGAEPDLTLSTLANAQGVVFVLGADTGVTRSDMQVWSSHVCVATRSRNNSRIVVLNKIDSLWDELLDDEEIESNIAGQIAETAQLLKHPAGSILGISAAKALVARLRNDAELLKLSGITSLEDKLSHDVIPARKEILKDQVLRKINDLYIPARDRTLVEIAEFNREIDQLQGLRGKGAEIIKIKISNLERERQLFESRVREFKLVQGKIRREINAFLNILNINDFDTKFSETREKMQKAMTTRTLRAAMAELFERLDSALADTEQQSERIRKLFETSYKAFRDEHGLADIEMIPFDSKHWISRLTGLLEDAEVFRTSTEFIVTEQHFLVKKFFVTMVAHMRQTINDCRDDAQAWSDNVLRPIRGDIERHQRSLNERLDNLRSLKVNQLDIDQRVAALQKEIEKRERGLNKTESVLNRIEKSVDNVVSKTLKSDQSDAVSQSKTA